MDNPMATASPGRGGIKGWVKKNKLVAGLIVSVAGFFFLSKKGSSSGGGGNVVSADGTTSSGPVQLVPVSAPPSEGSTDTTVYPNDPSYTDMPVNDTGSGNEGGSVADGGTVVAPVVTPTNDAPAPEVPSAPTNPAPAQQGVTVAGHFFAGATGHVMVSSGKNTYGSYSVHKISFPGRIEYWWHYNSGSASGKWTGPHTSSGVATPPPASSSSGGGGGGGGTSSPAPSAPKPSAPSTPQPISAPNVFYNPTRGLRYIVKKHSNNRNYRHYESVLNKGDWGSRSDLIIPQ